MHGQNHFKFSFTYILSIYIGGVVFTRTNIFMSDPAAKLTNLWPIIFAMKQRASETHHADMQPL